MGGKRTLVQTVCVEDCYHRDRGSICISYSEIHFSALTGTALDVVLDQDPVFVYFLAACTRVRHQQHEGGVHSLQDREELDDLLRQDGAPVPSWRFASAMNCQDVCR